MSNKAELRSRKAKCVSEKSSKLSDLSDLKAYKKRLEHAIKSAEGIQEDFNSEHTTYKSIKITKNEWSGETRNKADNKKDDLDNEIKDYSDKYNHILEQMNKDLEKIEKKISGLESDIASLNSEIASIDRELGKD